MTKLMGIVLIATSLFAVDYTNMSVDELANLRGSVPAEDRDAFRSAFQEKTQYMSPEERMAYSKGQGQGNGQMTRQRNQTKTQQRLRDGSGSGGQYQGSRSGGSRGGGGGGGRR
ncbi:MAG: hypothetical protein KAQ94_00950 [Arcobacteraceae bacterium]|nr:hypothetical protein [Arcobacteraceae bacterium]